ncbi:MAG: adenosine kinase [Lentisphaerae bacterium]|nr:adenosine kinase [Lentisphaerota bacterium]
MSTQFSVIGVGSPIIDLIAQVDENFLSKISGDKGGMVMIDSGELTRILSMLEPGSVKRSPGGSAANTLFDLAHFGVRTALLGTAGEDEAGAFYRSELQKAGGSIHALRSSVQGTPTGHCICLVTPDAERTMRPALAAALEFDPAQVTADDFADYTLAHLEGYLLAHSEEKLRFLMSTAQAAGCKISLDLASFEVVNAFRPAILRLLEEFVDIVFANSDEADALLGRIPPEEQLAQLRKLCPAAVVKLGEHGAWADCGAGARFIPANKVNAVDTTAAGDSFAAGFLYGYLSGKDAEFCGRLGAALAAETVQVFGASLPESSWKKLLKMV